jgi:hypothetical protein
MKPFLRQQRHLPRPMILTLQCAMKARVNMQIARPAKKVIELEGDRNDGLTFIQNKMRPTNPSQTDIYI